MCEWVFFNVGDGNVSVHSTKTNCLLNTLNYNLLPISFRTTYTTILYVMYIFQFEVFQYSKVKRNIQKQQRKKKGAFSWSASFLSFRFCSIFEISMEFYYFGALFMICFFSSFCCILTFQSYSCWGTLFWCMWPTINNDDTFNFKVVWIYNLRKSTINAENKIKEKKTVAEIKIN